MQHLWRNPPEDQHDWIGFTTDEKQDGSKNSCFSAAEIELLLERNNILSGSTFCSNQGVATQTEKDYAGITSLMLSIFAEMNDKIPGIYFDLNIGFTTETLLMRKSVFNQFMDWLTPFLHYSSEKLKSHEFLLNHPEKGLEVVFDRLFMIWCLKQHWTVYDMKTNKSYLDAMYETDAATHHVSLGCVNYNRAADENLLEATRTGRIAGGRFVEELEKKFCKKLAVKHAISVCNGTMADAIALSAITTKTGIKKVITPALTFIAQANAILHAGLTPIFVDVGEDGLLDDIPESMDSKDCIVYPVHLMGKVCPSVSQLANRYPVLEDACEALGSQVNGKYAGTMGIAGTFSMYVSHSFTSGEGGMIVTDDDEMAMLCRSIRAHGRLGDEVGERFRFPRLGFNGKMSNLQAAYATAHFDDFEEIIEMRKQVVQKLANQLGDDFGVASDGIVAHGFPVLYPDKTSRDRALIMISKKGIECRPLFSCIASEHFNADGDFPNAENISSRYLYVPCHHQLSEREIGLICQAVCDSKELIVK
tara:strand:+ start:6464 stop:8065 length:1602 start_codon:yes stop_codon:yes gene_type:complete